MSYDLSQSGFMRLPAVLKVIPVSKSTWWEKVRQGVYPQPVKLAPRITAWRVADIYSLVERFGKGNPDVQ